MNATGVLGNADVIAAFETAGFARSAIALVAELAGVAIGVITALGTDQLVGDAAAGLPDWADDDQWLADAVFTCFAALAI